MVFCNSCHVMLEDVAHFCPHCGKAALRPLSPGSEFNLESWGKVVLGPALGRGGMGVVYRGWLYYSPTGQYAGTPAHPVAVKVLSALLSGSPEAQRSFRKEAEALRRLSHPNIVQFLGLSDTGELALVMELVQGEALSAILTRAAQGQTAALPCLPLLPAWHYFSQLLGALAAIHALGIVHRDVKPANVLVRTDGVIKLSDFGIVRLPTEQARASGALIPGTGAYMAPEQVLGKDIDSRADLYSAAIVFYEMLAGHTPFDLPERAELEVRRAQLTEIPPPIRKWVPQAPAILDEWLARALAKDPAVRFNSALELGETLRVGLGLPENQGWRTQQALAGTAQTLSNLAMEARDARLEAEIARYRTELMKEFTQAKENR